MLKLTKYNRFDIYLIVIIVIQVFGIYGGALQPVRVLSILSFPFLIMSNFKADVFKQFSYEFLFFFIFIISGLTLTIFSEYINVAIKEVLYLAVSFNMIFNIIIASSRAKHPKLSIITAWLLFLIISLPIGLYEIFFNWHFSNSKIEAGSLLGGHYNTIRKFAALTFGNFNLFNVVIVYAVPFVISFLLMGKKKKYIKFLVWILIILAGFIVLVNGSRGSFLAIFICFLLFLFKSAVSGKTKNILYLIVLVFFTINYLFTKGSDLILTFTDKQDRLFSDSIRMNLLKFSLNEFSFHNFLGVGPANIELIIVNKYGYIMGATHNLFLEILVQYGMIVFMGFLYFLYKIYKQKSKVDRISKFIIFTSILLIPLTSIINSKYLAGVNVWLFLASLIIISNNKFKKLT